MNRAQGDIWADMEPRIDPVELTLYFAQTLIEFDTLSEQEKQEKIQTFRIIAALCRNLLPDRSPI